MPSTACFRNGSVPADPHHVHPYAKYPPFPSGGKAPPLAHWQPHDDVPCACKNDTEVCDVAQTCLWFTVGTSIGCKEPDGGAQGGANPNNKATPSSV